MNRINAPYVVEQYFARRMQDKVFLLNRHSGSTSNFWQHRVNALGGYCYFLSVLALLGLENNDRRFCGTIDTIPREGYTIERNYKHSWVEFAYKGRQYVYDSLVEYTIPQESWYKLCSPRDITSSLTQKELLLKYLSDKYAHKITGSFWQFKSEDDKLRAESEEDGYIFKALAKGQLMGNFEKGSCDISTFIADEPRLYY